MARLTYAILALALGALISGFFVRTSALPLIASTALSAIVAALILGGWSRKLRKAGFADEDAEEAELAEDIVVVDLDDADDQTMFAPAVETDDASTAKGARGKKAKAAKPITQTAPLEVLEPATNKPQRSGRRQPAPPRARRVVVLPGRSRYHSQDCRFASGKDAREVLEVTARRRALVPCSVCLGNRSEPD